VRATDEETLSIERVGVALGAQVSGIDLKGPLPDESIKYLEEALYEHQVLLFRGQHLTADQQLDLANRLGFARVPQPHRFLGETSVLQTFERTAAKPPTTDTWHTDTTFMANPPMIGMLAALVVPSVGGDTAWASMYSLYDSLSAPMKEFCEGLSGEHTIDAVRPFVRSHFGEEADGLLAEAFPPRLHPLVQRHPRTGRKHLFLGGTWMPRIADLNPTESGLLLDYFQRGMDDINIQLRWRWSEGDIAIWDQRSVVHRGLADHYPVDPNRTVRSVFVEGADDTVPHAAR
jgi:taurine dioxygenase